jgi:predicted TIM-barrel fold metal-dependent hydrolase
MIIDMHRHMWSVSERHPAFATLGGGVETELPLVPDIDGTADGIVAEMDESGVDVTVLVLADYHMRLGDAIFSPEGENRVQTHMAQRHPSRLISFFGMDPRRPDAIDLFDIALREWGAKGLKLHPTVGYFPHDPVCYPFYEKCVEYGVPVISHTGPMASPLYSRYTMPIEFDQIAADFPDLTLILAHSGTGQMAIPHRYLEALAIACEKPNVLLELSCWQLVYQRDPGAFVLALDRMRNEVGIERILFASDFPGTRAWMPLSEWVGVFRGMPALGEEHGVRFDDRDVDAMLGGNGARVLGL